MSYFRALHLLMCVLFYLPVTCFTLFTLFTLFISSSLAAPRADALPALNINALVTSNSQSRGPWLICLIIEGREMVYPAQVYGVQNRYESWNAEWRRHRPQGYPTDEEMGLLTQDQLQSMLLEIQQNIQSVAHPQTTSIAPPCDIQEVSKRSQKYPTNVKIRAQLWVLSTLTPALEWYHWELINPHLSASSASQKLIQTVVRSIHSSVAENVDVDLLLHAAERGRLTINTQHKVRVYLNEIDYGIWPRDGFIYLPQGSYTLRAVPLDTHLKPVSYTEIEVIAKRLTRFQVTVD